METRRKGGDVENSIAGRAGPEAGHTKPKNEDVNHG
jgi:hypothetical protein